MVHGGVCALAAGKAKSETVIANNRNKTTAVDFLLENCNFPFLLCFIAQNCAIVISAICLYIKLSPKG